MQETQGSHCKCHFLCPLKEWIICGYPDKVHNYGYSLVWIQIAMVMGIIWILPICVSPKGRLLKLENESDYKMTRLDKDKSKGIIKES